MKLNGILWRTYVWKKESKTSEKIYRIRTKTLNPLCCEGDIKMAKYSDQHPDRLLLLLPTYRRKIKRQQWSIGKRIEGVKK